ncbi:cytosolic protein [Bifidobacterium cuniculi]|uniref:Cytosolic protein n=2 Tax=Bifidobacterium cuniculi TaxID=1688 RepID=A0A087B2P2_9BIFI|nr:cytosolic protein [Bifidobacterium cuniculi]
MTDNENTNTTNNSAMPDFGEGLRKVFLAGVGALATTAEKGQELVNKLVERGELTVDQGKKLNSELAHKAGTAKDSIKEQAQAATQTVRDAAAGLKAQATADAADDAE